MSPVRIRKTTPHWRTALLYYWLLELVLLRIDKHSTEEGNCLLWNGAMRHETALLRMPHARLRSLRMALGESFINHHPPQHLSVRTLLTELGTHKKPPPTTSRLTTAPLKCECRNCINPQHASYLSASQYTQRAQANMPEGTKRLRAARLSKPRKLSDAGVMAIRTQTHISGAEIARRLGVSKTMATGIRSGRFRRSVKATPWTGLI